MCQHYSAVNACHLPAEPRYVPENRHILNTRVPENGHILNTRVPENGHILNTRVPKNGPKSSKACVRALVEVSTCTPENGRPYS